MKNIILLVLLFLIACSPQGGETSLAVGESVHLERVSGDGHWSEVTITFKSVESYDSGLPNVYCVVWDHDDIVQDCTRMNMQLGTGGRTNENIVQQGLWEYPTIDNLVNKNPKLVVYWDENWTKP